MSEDTGTTDGDVTETDGGDDAATVEKEAFLSRLNKEGEKRKAAEKRASDLEASFNELRAKMDERESEGLPELERERKRAEALEKRIAEAEDRAAKSEQAVERTKRERWITAAASRENFVDPEDAARYLDVADIEDADAAEKAVKRLAKGKKHLVKPQDSTEPLISRVLQDGRPATPAKANGGIDESEEAQMLAGALKSFIRQ